jgi:hypothetical protein
LIAAYRASPDFTRPVTRTSANYQKVFDFQLGDPARLHDSQPGARDQSDPASAPANRPRTDAEYEIVLGEATGGLKVAIALGIVRGIAHRHGLPHRVGGL